MKTFSVSYFVKVCVGENACGGDAMLFSHQTTPPKQCTQLLAAEVGGIMTHGCFPLQRTMGVLRKMWSRGCAMNVANQMGEKSYAHARNNFCV